MLRKIIITAICTLAIFGNVQVSHAEIQTYEGIGEYIMSDFETPDIAKQRAKARAEQNAVEQAGVYVKSYTRTVNNTIADDEVIAIANTIIKIIDVQYTTTPIKDSGGSFQIVAKIRATIDSTKIDEWIKQDKIRNKELVEQNKQLQNDKAKLDAELVELRRKLASVSNAQEKRTLEKDIVSADRQFLANQKIEEGWRLYAEKNYISAIDTFSQAIGLSENNARSYYGRGSAYNEQGNCQQAIADFNKAISLNQNFAEAYYNRGVSYKRLGNIRQANADFAKSKSLGYRR